MPDVASVLKQEIARVSRKEIRSQLAPVKQASAQYRRDIAALKREVAALQKRLQVLDGLVLKTPPKVPAAASSSKQRFSPKGLRSQRKRLGLSADACGTLLGVTAQSIYNWERGVSRPREAQLGKIAALRSMGKKEAQARLDQLAN